MGRPEEAGEAPEPRRGRLSLQLIAATAAGHACATNSYALGWGVAANWQLRRTADGGGGALQLSDDQRVWLNPMLFLGTAFGCLLASRASARFGPRGTMLHSLVPLTLGHVLVALSTSFAVLMAGRLVLGLSSGLSYGVYVLYISGTSSPRYRGTLTILADIICLLAIIGVVALGEVLGWRWLTAVCGAVSLLPTGAALALLPDDPIWLLSRGRLTDAKRSAAAFDLDLEMADTSTLDADQAAGGWRETLQLLTRRKNLKPLGIVATLVLFNSFSGYMAILSYSLEFFRQAGLPLDAAVSSILFCALRVLAVIVTSTVVDRLGRRVLLVASCGGVSLCYLGLAAYYRLPALQQYPVLPIVLLLAAAFVYSTGLACLPFCLVGEMFPLRMRELGGSLVTFGYAVFTMLATVAFPATLAALGVGGLFLAHAAIMAAAALFTLLVLPETRGLSLAAIETLFDGDGEAPAGDGGAAHGGRG